MLAKECQLAKLSSHRIYELGHIGAKHYQTTRPEEFMLYRVIIICITVLRRPGYENIGSVTSVVGDLGYSGAHSCTIVSQRLAN